MPAPSKALLLLEVTRSIFEYVQGILLSVPLQYISPKGDGHPVIIFPGLGGSDGSTQYMRDFLSSMGYTVYPWGLGRNLGPKAGLDVMLSSIEEKVTEIHKTHGTKVSLIGWSLGGIYAREIAKKCPYLIRQVITLGTPFKGDPGSTNATFLYELLSKDKSHHNAEVVNAIAQKPSIPFTSIYSKTDGVVHWGCSLEEEDIITENIEIPYASHLGLGHNPASMFIIANRLAQLESDWTRWKR